MEVKFDDGECFEAFVVGKWMGGLLGCIEWPTIVLLLNGIHCETIHRGFFDSVSP